MSELRPRGRRGPAGIARHGRLPRRGPWGTLGKLVVSIVAVLAVSTAGIGASATWDLLHSSPQSVHLAGEGKTQIANIAAIQGGVNIVLVGSDTRTGQGSAYGPLDDSEGTGNNDVTMLVHIAQNHRSMDVVSFPRDTELPIPACQRGGETIPAQSQNMLNTTLAEGGLSCVVSTVKQLTGVSDIPFAAMITFDGVVQMSDAVGGVPVCIEHGIDDPYTSLDLPAGKSVLKGKDALEFLRTRHGVGDGSDLGRISNQQVFLSALARKIESAGTLTNPVRIWELANATVKNVTLSDQLDSPTILFQIAKAMAGISLSDVTFIQYPTVSDPENVDRVIVNQAAAPQLDQALDDDQPIEITAGTGDGDQASIVKTSKPTATKTSAPSATSKSGTKTSAPIALGGGIYGQNAATHTCSNGQD